MCLELICSVSQSLGTVWTQTLERGAALISLKCLSGQPWSYHSSVYLANLDLIHIFSPAGREAVPFQSCKDYIEVEYATYRHSESPGVKATPPAGTKSLYAQMKGDCPSSPGSSKSSFDLLDMFQQTLCELHSRKV